MSSSHAFDRLAARIEQNVDNPAGLRQLRDDVAAADVDDGERERLDGLLDRYEEDARLQAEAAETEAVLWEEGL